MQAELLTTPEIYDKEFPNFVRPKILGYIGLENLKFARKVHEGQVQFDLNLHLDRATHREQEFDVKLTELLKFLVHNEQRLKFPTVNKLDDSLFFCYRGLMTLIACTPYENREPWKITVTLFKGHIFLCARFTEEKLHRLRNMSEMEKRCTSWGYKFEQFVLSDGPDSEPNPDMPVDETEEFSLVFSTLLKHHKIVYGAEIDGVQCSQNLITNPPPTDSDPDGVIEYLSDKKFIELKTNRHIDNQRQETSFRRFKAKKWWCQSFLAGIDTILCGYRNDHGIVENLKVISVNDLPKPCKRFWKGNVCFNFLDTFLTYVKRCLAREIKRKYGDKAVNTLRTLPLTSLLVEWKPGGPVFVSENYVQEDDPILEQWFIENYGKSV